MRFSQSITLLCVAFISLFQFTLAYAESEPPAGDAKPKVHTTGQMVLARCQSALNHIDHGQNVKDYDMGWCLGFVKGIANGYLFGIGKNRVRRSRRFCPPAGATVGQQVRTIVKFLQDHPKHLHKSGAALSLFALIKAFPCS